MSQNQKIKAAIILCAGYGKRLKPLTHQCPKPLLKINKITLLENNIKLIKKIGIKKIYLNSFHLKNKIFNYVNKNNFDIPIKVIEDGKLILGTGGGIKNILSKTNDQNFIVFNPDTIWNKNYINCIIKMRDIFIKKKLNNILLVVNKKLSFDRLLNGDFQLEKGKLKRTKFNKYIYTGCQIFNRELFKKITKETFSMQYIWNQQLKKGNLYGIESLNTFKHITDIRIYKKLSKSN